MEQPSPKRRRISPPGSKGATSVRKNTRPTRNSVKKGSDLPASFISPTKASLSRFHPDLLPQPRSSERRRSTRKPPQSGTPASNVSKDEILSNENAEIHAGNGPSNVNEKDIEVEDSKNGPTIRSGLSAPPRRRSQTPNAQQSPSKSSRVPSAQTTRRSTSVISRKASQPEGTTNDEGGAIDNLGLPNGITIDSASLEKLPATPTPRGLPLNTSQLENIAPHMPSTPSQLGLESPHERPKGLLFGTPNKRTRRERKHKDRHESSQRESETPANENAPMPEHAAITSLGPKLFLSTLPKPPLNQTQLKIQAKNNMRTDLEQEVLTLGSTVVREALLSSWEEPAAQERKSLEKQQKRLMDVSERLVVLREDIEKLEILVSGSVDRIIKDSPVQRAPETDEAIDVSKSKPLSLSRRLANFFPFHNNDNPRHLPSISKIESDVLLKHAKISNSNLEDCSSDPELSLQSHEVLFISEEALVEEKLRLTLDSRSLQVLKINTLALDALNETTPVRPLIEEWINDDSHSKDLSSIGRAIHSGSTLVKKRKECWQACMERFGSLVAHDNPHEKELPNDMMIFQRKSMSLNIRWAINLKDDGAGETDLSILANFPQSWWEQRILLGREVEDVRAVFDLLVRERGVTEAIIAIVNLLFLED